MRDKQLEFSFGEVYGPTKGADDYSDEYKQGYTAAAEAITNGVRPTMLKSRAYGILEGLAFVAKKLEAQKGSIKSSGDVINVLKTVLADVLKENADCKEIYDEVAAAAGLAEQAGSAAIAMGSWATGGSGNDKGGN